MPGPAHRVGDASVHGGTVSKGALTVTIGGSPAARLGDTVPEPLHGSQAIATGSATVFIEGQPAARLGDTLACGATLTPTQTTVEIG